MNRSSRRTLITLAVAAGVLLLLSLLSGNAVTFYTDWLWFNSVGHLSVVRTRVLARAVCWATGMSLALGFLAVNWLILPKRLVGSLRLPSLRRGRLSLALGERPVTLLLCLIGALVALTMASTAAGRWMGALKVLHAEPFGFQDPIFSLDASFYVLRLPFYRFVVGWAMGLVIVTLIGSGLIYGLGGHIRQPRAIGHLSVLGALFLVDRAVDYSLQRWALLQSARGVVSGAGYTDVHARMPMLYLLAGIVLIGALLLLINVFLRRWKWLLFVGLAWLALGLIGEFYPAAMQRFTVEPNELKLEREYIEHAIRFTRYAYGLSDIDEFDYQLTGELTSQDLQDNADTLNNARLWDWIPLRETYEQLQEFRTYYTFADVDVDRYMIDGELRQVNLAVRELDVEQMREDARTWINRHLIYTHGYGLCLSPVSEVTGEGLPRFLVRDIPPTTEAARLEITRPEIYFGEKTSDYAIVNTTEDEFDHPSGDQNVYTRYEAQRGVPLRGPLRRIAFALRFNSGPVLVSQAIQSESRVLFHRLVSERVGMVAPMLWLDGDPYPVIADGRIIWLIDAYTWTDRFPYSRSTRGLNYIRNSVKVAVDAYTGDTTLYVVDPDDPLIRTYQSIFPELFTPVDEMDSTLRDHWRYPEQLFLIQAELYGAYHMRDPRVFYNQEDLWEAPMEVRGSGTTEMSPYYVTARLPGSDVVEFILIRPYVPSDKHNMIAWLHADSDGSDYGRLGVYKFSKESLVYGPMQVESRVEQDTTISEQLTLWDQRGSSVNRGNLIVLPINGALLYIEPVYLQAEASHLPELKRVIVAYQDQVVMAESFAQGLDQVLGQIAVSEGAIRDSGTGSDSAERLSAGAAELARSAQAHYDAAQKCLEQEDWACYGEELSALEKDLDALVEIIEKESSVGSAQ